MALGFRNCCNQFDYFLLSETPATVSEYEVYYIETLEGPTFCGSYSNLPPVNYSLPVYTPTNIILQGLYTEGCDNCILLNPCPTEESILENQFGEGSVILQPDCNFTTIRQMQIECLPISPTYENSLDGIARLFVIGGTPPYTFSERSRGILSVSFREDDIYTVLTQIPAGTYRFNVFDSTGDFSINLNCLITAPPPLPVFACNTTDATYFGKPDGKINFTVLSAGTQPYRYRIFGINFNNLPITINAGTFTIFYSDRYYTQQITCTVGQPPEVIFPDYLCLEFTFCGTLFRLSFIKLPTKFNYRAQFQCENPEVIGVTSLFIRWQDPGGWFITPTVVITDPQFTTPCLTVVVGQQFLIRKNLPLSEQPTGNWTGQGFMVPATGIDTSAGQCIPLLGPIVVNPFRGATPVEYGNISVVANGGTKDYIYIIDGPQQSFYSQTPVIDGLLPGDYKISLQDSNGVITDTKTFTIVNELPVNLFNLFNPCVITTYTNTWLNQTPGSKSIEILKGETRSSSIKSICNFNFYSLPINSKLTARITIMLTNTVVVGPTGYTDPNLVVVMSPEIVEMNVTTNGNQINIFDGVEPIYKTYPYVLNGNWYKQNNGNSCCLFPSEEGVTYAQEITWRSNEFYFDSSTYINTSFLTYFENSIPSSRYPIKGCVSTDYCSGYVQSNLKVSITDIVSVAGNVTFAENYKELYRYTFRNHSNGVADWVKGENPNPSCT
jgi:hypothetical protein